MSTQFNNQKLLGSVAPSHQNANHHPMISPPMSPFPLPPSDSPSHADIKVNLDYPTVIPPDLFERNLRKPVMFSALKQILYDTMVNYQQVMQAMGMAKHRSGDKHTKDHNTNKEKEKDKEKDIMPIPTQSYHVDSRAVEANSGSSTPIDANGDGKTSASSGSNSEDSLTIGGNPLSTATPVSQTSTIRHLNQASWPVRHTRAK